MAKKRATKDCCSDDEHETEHSQAAAGKKEAPKKGWNYTAIVIMMMFILPGFIAVVMQVYDIMYPEAKAQRLIKERVIKCYEVANPTKLSEVDKIVEKYKGRENALYAQLRAKYQKFPQCS